ncbi:MAG: hypothetical protein K0Q43_4980, partial [Ramlibacter sp.]|nr:hypothetical protein [Ramlibacter sp.]
MAISQSQLESLYLAYFGRPADFDGLVFYTSNPNFDIWSVAAAFSASPESQALYGTGVAPNFISAATINAIYQNLFNRDAEPAGLSYWAGEVASGRLTAAGAAYGILLGAQNDDAIAVANKLAASAAFTAALDTAPEIIGYTGDDAAAAARAWLATVSADPATLTAALAGVDAAVAAVVAVGGTIGPSYTLTTGVDTIAITDNTTINTISSVVAAAGSTLTVGDSIDGNGKTILQVAMAGATAVPFTTLQDIKTIELINADSATVSFQAAGWTNIGEIVMESGLAGGAARFANLQAGVDLGISVAGTLSASYTDGVSVYFSDMNAGDNAAFVDGNVSFNLAADSTGASLSVSSTGDLTLGSVTVTAGDGASFDDTDLWASGDLTVGNIMVTLGNSVSMDSLEIDASGSVTIGDLTFVQGDNGESNDISISSTDSGDVTVGNISLTIGDYTDTTPAEFSFDVYAESGNLTVGNITGVLGDSGNGLSIDISNYYGNLNVGSVGLIAGDSTSLSLEIGNWSGTGDVAVGFVAMEVGISSSLDLEISATGTSGDNVGSLTVNGLSFVLAEDADGEVDVIHSSTGTLTGTSAETIGALTVGNIDMNLGSDATLDVSITQAMWGAVTADGSVLG